MARVQNLMLLGPLQKELSGPTALSQPTPFSKEARSQRAQATHQISNAYQSRGYETSCKRQANTSSISCLTVAPHADNEQYFCAVGSAQSSTFSSSLWPPHPLRTQASLAMLARRRALRFVYFELRASNVERDSFSALAPLSSHAEGTRSLEVRVRSHASGG